MSTITRQALRSDPRSVPEQTPCDCLEYCGSDPALNTGKAYPCRHLVELQTSREEASELNTLAVKCSELWARAVLSMASIPVLSNGQIHIDTTPGHGDDKQWLVRVNEAARLLVLLKKAEQHPTHPHLLRLL